MRVLVRTVLAGLCGHLAVAGTVAAGDASCGWKGLPPEALTAETQATELFLPDGRPSYFELAIDLDGETRRVVLARKSGAAAAPADEASARPAVYRGRVEGWPHALVSASLVDDGLQALIVGGPGGAAFSISPASAPAPTQPGAARAHRTRPFSLPPRTSTGTHAATAVGPPVLEAEIAFDADYPFFLKAGGTEAGTLASVAILVDQASLFFEYFLDLRLKLNEREYVIRSTPESNIYQGLAIPQMRNAMRADWNANHAGIRRDTAYLFSGVVSVGQVGQAAVSSVCNLSTSYAAGRHPNLETTSSNVLNNALVLAHELGHVFGASHCNGESGASMLGGCGIMESNVGRPYFHGVSISEMQFRTGLQTAPSGCLDVVTPAFESTVLESVTPSSVTLLGGEITLTGQRLDQIMLLDWYGLLIDRSEIEFVSESTIRFCAPPADAPRTVELMALGVGGVDAIRVDVVACSGQLDPPVSTLLSLITAYWDFCGPVGLQGELLFSRSPLTKPVDGFQLLRYGAVAHQGIFGDGTFTDAAGVGRFGFTPPIGAEHRTLRSQLVVRDASGRVVAASPVSSHAVIPIAGE